MEQHRGRFKMYTPYRVARALDVSIDTVYRLVRRGELAAIKLDNLIRIHPQDLNSFLRSRRYTDVVKKRAVQRSRGFGGSLDEVPLSRVTSRYFVNRR